MLPPRAVRTLTALLLAIAVACGGRSVARQEGEPDATGGAVGNGGTGGLGGSGAPSSAGAPSATGGTMNGGAAGATGGGAGVGANGGVAGEGLASRSLTLVLADGPWQLGQMPGGMAVDADGRVYVMDSETVFLVEEGVVDVYLTVHDFDDAVQSKLRYFEDAGVAPDGALYVVGANAIVRATAPHEGELWHDFGEVAYPGAHKRLGVYDDDSAGLIGYEGLTLITSHDATVVYGRTVFMGSNGCATEDFSLALSGVFLYQAGCNGYPLLRGNLDGSGVGVLYEANLLGESNVRASNFACSASDPEGGFYVLVREAEDFFAPRLVHLTETSDHSSGFADIATAPSFVQAQSGDDVTFCYCQMAAADDGSVYVQTFNQLWKVSPGSP